MIISGKTSTTDSTCFLSISHRLRERRTDILLLAEYFLDRFNKENNKNIDRISTSAIDLLIQYHWPGNVRELQNCMERAVSHLR